MLERLPRPGTLLPLQHEALDGRRHTAAPGAAPMPRAGGRPGRCPAGACGVTWGLSKRVRFAMFLKADAAAVRRRPPRTWIRYPRSRLG